MAARITDVRAYPLKTRTALVRVSTNVGVDGIGEHSPMNVPVMCHFVETALRPIVLGQDPLDTERLWDAMCFGTHNLGTGGVQPPHMTQPTIGNAASLHLCATIPLSSRPHEYTGPRADLDRLFTDPWELRDGTTSIPDRPGLGLTIDPRGLESACES